MLMLSCAARTMVLLRLSLLQLPLLHGGRVARARPLMPRTLDSTEQAGGVTRWFRGQVVFIDTGFIAGSDLWPAEQAGVARDSTPLADVATCMAAFCS
jgi:hypothetical protein